MTAPSVTFLDDDPASDDWLALHAGGSWKLSTGEPFASYAFRTLHPDAVEQDTYDETVEALGFDPLAACPHGDRCAGAECCCAEAHRRAS